jgi:hypothetical protein
MANLLRCNDRQGRAVVLTEECWYGKILVDHPDMEDQISGVEVTLRDPDGIRLDRTHLRREYFYRTQAHARYSHLYAKVVVEYANSGAQGVQVGRVVTAYLTNDFKQGEQASRLRPTPATHKK